MTSRQYSIIGMIVPVWFLIVYITMSSLRPEYSFLTKAISELGTLDAPNKWWWNVFGYILPGLMIAIFGIGLFKSVSPEGKNKFPMIGILGSGLSMSFSGIFPGDLENMQSITTSMHVIGSFGSYVFFLICAFTFPKQMKKSDYWRPAAGITLALTLATILFGAWPFIFPHMPGVGQRLVFFFYFLWILYTALKLFKVPSKESKPHEMAF